MTTIFIAEDDRSILRLLKLTLEFAGFKVIGTAENGEKAVQKYKVLQEKPDIILMDYRMPIKNGLEATKNILELDKCAKIIFISADYSIKSKALALGASFFIEKPFDNKLLINIINSMVENTLHYSLIELKNQDI